MVANTIHTDHTACVKEKECPHTFLYLCIRTKSTRFNRQGISSLALLPATACISHSYKQNYSIGFTIRVEALRMRPYVCLLASVRRLVLWPMLSISKFRLVRYSHITCIKLFPPLSGEAKGRTCLQQKCTRTLTDSYYTTEVCLCRQAW